MKTTYAEALNGTAKLVQPVHSVHHVPPTIPIPGSETRMEPNRGG